jgi:hypothetical protein
MLGKRPTEEAEAEDGGDRRETQIRRGGRNWKEHVGKETH